MTPRVRPLVGRLVGQSVIIFSKGKKLHFHALIGIFVFFLSIQREASWGQGQEARQIHSRNGSQTTKGRTFFKHAIVPT